MGQIFTRAELHELVWSKPVTEIAKTFLLSDVAIHKICRKHDIPTPDRGWWAKKAAGRNMRWVKLPPLRDGVSDRIAVAAGELREEEAWLAIAREAARVKASDYDPNTTVAENQIVSRTILKLEKASPNERGLVTVKEAKVVQCEVAPTSVARLAGILNSIVAAAALQGFRLENADGGAHFSDGQETIGWSVTEVVTRARHKITPDEQAATEKWQRNTRKWDDYARYLDNRPIVPEWDYHCSGDLSVRLEDIYFWHGQSPRRSFKDGKSQRLEKLANDIAVGIAVLVAAKIEDRRRRAIHEQEMERQRFLREMAQRAEHVEKRRTTALGTILVELEKIGRLEGLIDNLRMNLSQADGRVSEFVRWAGDHLASQKAALSEANLARWFEEQRLFGPDDDHGFYSSRY